MTPAAEIVPAARLPNRVNNTKTTRLLFPILRNGSSNNSLMKRFTFIHSTALAVLLFAFTSCLVEDTVPGPPGPPGPPGNANVWSFYYNVNYTSWNIYGAPGMPNHSIYFEKYIPEITQDIIDYGMVAAYIYDHDVNAWVALPYTYTFAGTQEYYKFYTTTGIAGIDITLSSLQTPAPQSLLEVKVVVVAGYVRQQHPDLDWSNYEAVKKQLNLE